MVNLIKKQFHLFIIVAAFTLNACSSSPVLNTVQMDSFPKGDAENVFAVGFNNIVDKYINSITPGAIVLEGLKGLSSLDTTISISQSEDQIVLEQSSHVVETYEAPLPEDIEGWAYTATQLIADSRQYSNDILAASEEELYEIIFDGALSTLDIYSRYAGNNEASNNRAKRDGFGGIGIQFKLTNNHPLISKVLINTPAQRAGLQVNDELIAVNNDPVEGVSPKEIAKSLRGPVGSIVSVTVTRNSHIVEIYQIVREHIIPETVTANLRNDILHLKIEGFNHGTADTVLSELQKNTALSAEPIKGIILDLRGNPGGLLKQSIKIADVFLSQGSILDTKGRHSDSLQHYEAKGEDKARGVPIVVLIDGGSASASEIVAAALQDSERAVVLGTVSYGKGTVQTVIRLPNNGELILTWSRFMAPSGYALHGLGVYPVICTSGIQDTATKELLKKLELQTGKRDTLSKWRQVEINNTSGRNDLRAKCSPENHKGNKDLRLARLLIEDSVLYYRALDLNSATAQAID